VIFAGRYQRTAISGGGGHVGLIDSRATDCVRLADERARSPAGHEGLERGRSSGDPLPCPPPRFAFVTHGRQHTRSHAGRAEPYAVESLTRKYYREQVFLDIVQPGCREGLPVSSSELWKQAEPWMAKRSGHAVNGGLEGRSERPARGRR